MSLWLLSIPLTLVSGLGVRLWYRRWRARRRMERRRIEAPNSHYSSAGVRNQVDRERWGGIDVRVLHPLNSDEVGRLLEVMDSDGINALSSKDRLFLDNMTIPRLG